MSGRCPIKMVSTVFMRGSRASTPIAGIARFNIRWSRDLGVSRGDGGGGEVMVGMARGGVGEDLGSAARSRELREVRVALGRRRPSNWALGVRKAVVIGKGATIVVINVVIIITTITMGDGEAG